MHSQQIAFDAGLLRRYDRPGPRYTSYPTAPQFSADFGEAQLREVVQASNEELATVNDELNNRNHELSLVNGTLQRERDYSVSLVASLRK